MRYEKKGPRRLAKLRGAWYTAKLVGVLMLSLAIGFGLTYLVGWFLFGEANIMEWGWFGRVLFIVFGLSWTGRALSLFDK